MTPITARVLKERAAREGTSVNALLIRMLKKSLGLAKEKRIVVHHDLDHLAGTWSQKEYSDFKKKTADFETIDEKIWE